MKLRNILFIFAAITLGFASCSSESDILDEMNTPVEGLDKETVAVSFNLGKDFQTKAESTMQAPSIDEAMIHNCVIAIFDHATGTMLAKREFILNEGLNFQPGNYYTTSNMETKAIPSDVIVVANCPVGYFNNVVTKTGFDKAIQAKMGEINTLTASRLIKVWKSEDDHSGGIDLAVQTNRNIKVNLRQVAARVDMKLEINPEANDDKNEIYFETTSIYVTNVHYDALTFTPSNDGIFSEETKSYPDFDWYQEGQLQGQIDQSKNIVADLKGHKLIHSFYTYENSNKDDHPVTLEIEGNIVIRESNSESNSSRVKKIPITLRLITVEGSSNYIERGYLYEILGTINYEVQEEKVTFGLKYKVVDWYSGNTYITFN